MDSNPYSLIVPEHVFSCPKYPLRHIHSYEFPLMHFSLELHG